jgi:histidinol dehydrogenase
MKILSTTNSSHAPELAKLNRRCTPAAGVESVVAGVLTAIRTQGDAALLGLAEKFDKVILTPETLRVSAEEFAEAQAAVKPEVLVALEAAHANVLAFAKQSLRQDWTRTNDQGAIVGEIFQPFRRVGLYVPGGSAPLVSTVLMTATLAQAAGCEEIVVCTPCGKDGKVNSDMLVALQLAGATEVYRVGGAQAIGAMAYGTATIKPVDKIYGPGNKFVVEAKRQVFGTVAIDLLPGPSEIMVLCDDTAKAAFVAADLLAQAEHGHDGEIILVTTSQRIIDEVPQQIDLQLATLPRAEIIRDIIDKGAWLVLAKDLAEGISLCNAYAPEHLSLVVANDESVIPQIRTAGAIFLGDYAPVAAGDFVTGPSHTLPTGGAGKSFPGLTVDQFQRRTSIVRMDREALAKTAPIVVQFSEVEGLQAHGRSATIRLE